MNRYTAGDGNRFYANYHLDQEGAMSCLLLTPRGASVVRAARQLQRFFTIEQYRLLILARLPGAKSRYPVLAKLNDQYEGVAKAIRRMNSSGGSKEKKNRRYRQQQEFLEKITDLEQATAQELARAKSEVTIARAYVEIIESRFEDAGFKPLGGEVRFLPPFVQKRLDPAVSTFSSVVGVLHSLLPGVASSDWLLRGGPYIPAGTNGWMVLVFLTLRRVVSLPLTPGCCIRLATRTMLPVINRTAFFFITAN